MALQFLKDANFAGNITTAVDKRISIGTWDNSAFTSGDAYGFYVDSATPMLILDESGESKTGYVGLSSGLMYVGGIVTSLTMQTGAGANALIIDGNQNSTFTGNVGIGSAPVGNPATKFLAVGTAGSVSGGIQLWATNAQTHYIQFGDAASGGNYYRGAIGYAHASDTLLLLQSGSTALSFTGSQAATFAGNVKIGSSTTGTPATNADDLVIDKGASESGITIISTAASSIRFGDAANTSIGSLEYNHNSNYMRMIVNNAERMRINSAGNVGIGTTNPIGNGLTVAASTNGKGVEIQTSASTQYVLAYDRGAGAYDPLTVAGSELRFQTGNIYERMRIWSAGMIQIGSDATATPELLTLQAYTQNQAFSGKYSAAGYLWFLRNETGPSGRFQLMNAGNTTINLEGNTTRDNYILGNVGIGENVPTHQFEAKSALAKSFLLNRNAGNNAASLNEFSAYYSLSIKNRNAGSFLNFGGNGNLSNLQATDGLASATAKQINLNPYGGNVGIGMVNALPITKLHLGGTAPGDSIIRQDSTASGTNWEIGERVAGKWQIFEDDGDTIVTTFMSNGNVGIGEDDPDCKLHISESTNNSGSVGVLANGGLQVENTNTTANSWSQLHLKSVAYDAHLRLINDGTLKIMTDGNTNAVSISNLGNVTFTRTVTTSDVYGASSLRVAALGGILYLDSSSGASTIMRTNGTTPALTLSSSQNVTLNSATALDFQVADFAQIKFRESGAITIDSDNNQDSRNFSIKDGSGTNLLLVLDNGNIGIGNNAATAARLEIKGRGSTTALTVRTTDNAATPNETFFISDGGRAGVRFYPFSIGIPSTTSGASGARFQVATTVSGGDFVVLSDGKVGIGITAPGSKLMISDASNRDFSTAQFKIEGAGYTAAHYLDGTEYMIQQNSGSRRIRMMAQTNGVLLNPGATAWASASDIKLKENIKPLKNVLDKIQDYRCVEYNFKNDKDKKIGFIAQDWKNDFPAIIDEDKDGLLGMKYTETIPVLLKAIQEQQKQIKELQDKFCNCNNCNCNK